MNDNDSGDGENDVDSWGSQEPEHLQELHEFAGPDDSYFERASEGAWLEEEERYWRERAWAKDGHDDEEGEEEAENRKWDDFRRELPRLTAGRDGELWSREEDEILLYYWKGKSLDEIAGKLGRGPRAIEARIFTLVVNLSEINVSHSEGCRHDKLSGHMINTIEHLYSNFVDPSERCYQTQVEKGIEYVLEFFSVPICRLTVLRVLARAALLLPPDLDRVQYLSY